MKRICIIHSSMNIGGAETSLIGLLQNIDYNQCEVDLFLYDIAGEMMSFIPRSVNVKQLPQKYQCLFLPITEVIKKGEIAIASVRVLAKIRAKKYKSITYMTKHYAQYYVMPFLRPIKEKYDLALSFIDPHFIMLKKIEAKTKVAWLHTDFSRVDVDVESDRKMWGECDFIANVSDSCKMKFDEKYPELCDKSIVIENILSSEFLKHQSENLCGKNEIVNDNTIKLLSIGRFSEQKNFDNIPDICKRILDKGINVIWYLIGYGSDEELIRRKIAEAKVEQRVIVLGKKENPYPYITACDIYVQPSRYEGKAVTVREAQILNKPVVITDYATASSQLENGVDGVIVPMDNEGCAQGIVNLINNRELQQTIVENTKKRDYSNASEIEKIYNLIG